MDKEKTKKIAFNKGHAWKYDTALKAIKDNKHNLSELAGISDLNKNSFA